MTQVNDFNSSISLRQLGSTSEDIAGSIAHATMLGEQGIIAKEEADEIVAGLEGSFWRMIEAGKVEFTTDSEDIHMNMEALLTERIGDAGKRLHTARSRNDQVARGLPAVRQAGDPAHHRASCCELLDSAGQPGRGKLWMPSCPATPTCSGRSPSPSPTI